MALNDDIREALREKINRSGLTLRQAALQLGRSHNWLGLKLRGQSDMTFTEFSEICEGLGFDQYEILQDVRNGGVN